MDESNRQKSQNVRERQEQPKEKYTSMILRRATEGNDRTSDSALYFPEADKPDVQTVRLVCSLYLIFTE